MQLMMTCNQEKVGVRKYMVSVAMDGKRRGLPRKYHQPSCSLDARFRVCVSFVRKPKSGDIIDTVDWRYYCEW